MQEVGDMLSAWEKAAPPASSSSSSSSNAPGSGAVKRRTQTSMVESMVLASSVIKTLDRFMSSADSTITDVHVVLRMERGKITLYSLYIANLMLCELSLDIIPLYFSHRSCRSSLAGIDASSKAVVQDGRHS